MLAWYSTGREAAANPWHFLNGAALTNATIHLGRRELLWRAGGGLGGIALASLLARDGLLAAKTHHPPKARRALQLFMNGGVSHMDTFDHKPALTRLHGKAFDPGERVEAVTSVPGKVLKCPFPMRQHGECGRWVSGVFPHLARQVDRLAFFFGVAAGTNVHGPASYRMNTGFTLPGFPCLGAWLSYGLGHLGDDLPTFVVLPDARGLPYNNLGNFSAGFLPAVHQGTVLNLSAKQPIFALKPPEGATTPEADAEGLEALAKLNREHAAERPGDSRLEARIASYELAARMQKAAPEALDLSREPRSLRQRYGVDDPVTGPFARRCLTARRLIERGTRFVQVWSGAGGPSNNWDNHANIEKELPAIARTVDQPIAALLDDLHARGLFSDTLVVFSTEFGRHPFSQGSTGRDHNGSAGLAWIAGAGVKGGASHGESDEWGWRAKSPVTPHDIHATILHLLGIDHEKLTFRHNGSDRRLTDVHGHVAHNLLA
jgi:hypothetical protein